MLKIAKVESPAKLTRQRHPVSKDVLMAISVLVLEFSPPEYRVGPRMGYDPDNGKRAEVGD